MAEQTQIDKEVWDRMQDARARMYVSTRALRTWFIAYGVGAPALLISKTGGLEELAKSPCSGWIASLFIMGILIQIGAEIRSRYAWNILYCDILDGTEAKATVTEISRLGRRYARIRLGLDVFTLVLFLAATIRTICILWPSK